MNVGLVLFGLILFIISAIGVGYFIDHEHEDAHIGAIMSIIGLAIGLLFFIISFFI